MHVVSRFENGIDYGKCTVQELEGSLTEMRVILKELNIMLNKMMDKNYQYLAEKDQQVFSPEREMQLIRAQIDNAKKLIVIQESQITQLNSTIYDMQGKQSYEQELIDQILTIKQKMPNIFLQSKHNACDINRNGYVLVNQEQDNSQYVRMNILRADIQRGNQRLRKAEEKFAAILEKERELEEKNYEMGEKFQKMVQFAKVHSMQVTAHGTIISFHQKYSNLSKKKQQEMKRNALLEHVARNNEANISKKIADMKRLLTEYSLKEEELQRRLEGLEKQSAQMLKKSNLIGSMAQKSFSFRYAEVLLKGDKGEKQKPKTKKNDKNGDYDQYEDDFQDLDMNKSSVRVKNSRAKEPQQNILSLKPSLNMLRKKNEISQQRYQKSNSMVEVPLKNKKQEKSLIFQFEDDDKQKPAKNAPMFHVRRSSANQNLKKNDKREVNISLDRMPESPNVKHWKNQKPEAKDNEQKQYKSSKPLMNLRKKGANPQEPNKSMQKNNNNEEVQDLMVKPKFSRLTNKKTNSKMTDQYMDYLQEKGRKILGLS